MKYAESGELSRAWWLKQIKQLGVYNGARIAIKDGFHLKTEIVKLAFDDLIGQGYVEMTGKGGKDGYRYYPTSLGHRYLNEHQDELAEEGTDAWTKAQAEKIAARTGGIPESEPEKQSEDEKIDINGMEEPPEPGAEQPGNKNDAAAAPGGDYKEHMHKTMYSLLYERFADQVSAKELIEAL